uniref:Uncharacterized protein LOC114324361 n=1 Tax=Diabrotica virgifera virgifera TaxID=50390 RepID=A0A6P7EYB2_DIAVI
MNIFIVFPTAFCLFILVKSEEYIRVKVKKRYTIISSPYYYLPINTNFFNFFSVNKTARKQTLITSASTYLRQVKKYVLSDSIVMDTGMLCTYQSGVCYDLDSYLIFKWDEKKIMSTSENMTCLRNMMDFPLFRGMVEEWTISSLVKFLILDVNNTKRVLNLVNMKNICNKWLWTTDQDNVFVFESEDNLPNVMSNFSFSRNFKILDNTSRCSQEKLFSKSDIDCNHLILYIILYLIIFIKLRFVFGVITNFILLARINKRNLTELLVLSFSQNLTNQKIFFKEPESIENVYATAKSYEAVYESTENQYYGK